MRGNTGNRLKIIDVKSRRGRMHYKRLINKALLGSYCFYREPFRVAFQGIIKKQPFLKNHFISGALLLQIDSTTNPNSP